ncbi:MAG: hypothetical protein FJY98_00230 [Candidatus Liptonbacteria bacterium]|nr:hypothetical protein [Candidatus Liptonbacteria bacterium]
MKKVICGIAVLILGMQSGLVKAQTVTSGVRSLSATEAAALQAQITALKATVAELEAKVAAKRALEAAAALVSQVKNKLADPAVTAEEKATIGVGLMGLSTQLMAVQETLTPVAAKKAMVAVTPTIELNVQPVVVKSEEAEKPAAVAAVAESKSGKSVEEIVAKDKQTASIAGKTNWHGMIAIVVLIGLFAFILWKRERKSNPLPQS